MLCCRHITQDALQICALHTRFCPDEKIVVNTYCREACRNASLACFQCLNPKLFIAGKYGGVGRVHQGYEAILRSVARLLEWRFQERAEGLLSSNQCMGRCASQPNAWSTLQVQRVWSSKGHPRRITSAFEGIDLLHALISQFLRVDLNKNGDRWYYLVKQFHVFKTRLYDSFPKTSLRHFHENIVIPIKV